MSVKSAKLTKSYLSSLPTGVYLVSNCGFRDGPQSYKPVWANVVASPEDRERQWLEIKSAGANARGCDVFQDEDAWRESLKAIRWPAYLGADRGSEAVQ
jgi:hypothetical protein